MSGTITVRRLGLDDLDQYRAMNRLFAEAFDEPETYAVAPDEAYWRKLAGRSEFIALTASLGGDLAGALIAYELVKYEQQRSEIYIYDLAVLEEFRRCGVATALIEALKPVARKCGAWMMFVQADPVDGPAVALYEKLGSREQVLHFDINPAAGPPPTR